VCRHGDTLVFVEVKTRANEDLRRPLDDIKAFQKRQISKGALIWVRMLDDPDIAYRFDVVEVIANGDDRPRCELIQDAFQSTTRNIY
jgi:putative endonuclease